MTRSILIVAAAALALPWHAPAAAGPLSWFEGKVGDWTRRAKSGVAEFRDPGTIALPAGAPLRFWVGGDAPEAELPQGRSRFRRVELPAPIARATVRVRVIAQPADKGRGNTVFKPLLYVLDDEGNVRETVEIQPLLLDMRPFKKTQLTGCAKVEKLQKFLVATPANATGTSFESGARDAMKAKSNGGFYYATDPVKVKLPFAPTGEIVMTVNDTAADKRDCASVVAKAKTDAKPK
jgi:hypothetical protein